MSVRRASVLLVGSTLALSAACGEPPKGADGAHRKTPAATPLEFEAKQQAQQNRERLAYFDSVRRSAFDGAKWLERQQLSSGSFRYGWLPSINRPMPGDNSLRQAGSAAALARAASHFDDMRFRNAARRAIAALIETTTEIHPEHPDQRRSSLSPVDANPVGYCGLLVLAISELEGAAPDLVERGEELARYIRSRQRKDGSLNVANSFRDDAEDSPAAIAYFPGEALYALVRSHRSHPAKWKLDVVARAFDFYRNWWKESPAEAFVPWMTSAYAELHLATNEPKYADFAFQLADWALTLQHMDLQDAARGWRGGFGSFRDGQFLATEPGSTTASFGEGLVDAFRAAKHRGDAARTAVYREALDAAVPFLMSCQYTPERTSHFAATAAERLRGGFWASATDGTLRIDQNQHATNAIVGYVAFIVDDAPPTAGPRKSRPGMNAN